MQRNSSSSQKVLVKIDFVNVFTCVGHEVAFSEIRAKFLDLTRFTWYCQIPTLFAVAFFYPGIFHWVAARRPSQPLASCCSHPPHWPTHCGPRAWPCLAGELSAVAVAPVHVQKQDSLWSETGLGAREFPVCVATYRCLGTPLRCYS